jgi:molybdate transport system substrate-binding protein
MRIDEGWTRRCYRIGESGRRAQRLRARRYSGFGSGMVWINRPDSASGVYIERELFRKLGIEDQVKSKAKMVPKIPVASVVANGDYEVGFQQVSELLPVPGATFVGKIPESVQSVTRFAAGIPVGAPHPQEAKALLDYLASPAAQADVRSTGLDSVAAH